MAQTARDRARAHVAKVLAGKQFTPAPTPPPAHKAPITLYRQPEMDLPSKAEVAQRLNASTFDPMLYEAICQDIEQGTSLTKACESRGILKGTFWHWHHSHELLADRYARAQVRQADALFEELAGQSKELADRKGWLVWCQENKVDPKWISALASAMDRGIGRTMDILKRLNPTKYSEKVDVTTHNTNMLYVVNFGAGMLTTPNPAPALTQLVNLSAKDDESKGQGEDVIDVEPEKPKRPGRKRGKA